MFVTQTTLSLKCRSQARKARKDTENEAKAVKRAEKEYIKHWLFAVVHCLMFRTLPAGRNDVLLKSPHEKKQTLAS